MLFNYFKTSFRYLIKQKGYTLINLLGLSLGLATCIQIFLFVQDEVSYDRFHKEAGNIYRFEIIWEGEGQREHWAATEGFIIPSLMEKFPEIISGAKINFSYFPAITEYNGQEFSEKNFIYADSTLFDVFSFAMLQGNPGTALSGPGKLVMTKSTSKKYFGEDNAIGKIITLGGESFQVSGVIEDIPVNSHFHFDIAISMDHLRAANRRVDEHGPAGFYSYIRLPNRESAKLLEEKVNKDIYEFYGFVTAGDSTNMPDGWTVEARLKPITRIHLYSNVEKEIEPNSSISNVYIFSAVAVFILFIACVNYMNLATARSVKRSREVGLRKVLGSWRGNIFNQFMTESFILSFLSLIVAIAIVAAILPVFNEITGKFIELNLIDNYPLLLTLIIVLAITTVLAGAYPAIYLSGFSPLKAMKTNILNNKSGKTSLNLRRVLVITQFAISVLLIIATITVYRQIHFINKKNLGFEKEQVMVISMPTRNDQGRITSLKNELMKLPEVKFMSASSGIPGQRIPYLTVRIPGLAQEEVENQEEGEDVIGIRVLSGDADLLRTLGIKISEGRDFYNTPGNDENSAFILNEAAVKEFELENPVGQRFEYLYGLQEPKSGNIVGIAADFHFASLHNEVEPLMIHIYPAYNRYLLVKLSTNDMQKTLVDIDRIWSQTEHSLPMDYFFLDSYYDNMYKSELSMGKVITYFTIFAIIVACLGLLGLVSYIAEQKTREIGIRKVLGASATSVIELLGKEFLLLVVIGNLIAWVPAYYFIKDWLNSFAYSPGVNLWVFGMTALISILISVITVSAKAFSAARTNPAKALKYE
ncbi:MAG: ABC transporter permease [Bacteroidetes bacterium]|nr:ABC transporter permease [Bacteroidota bacterium]